MKFCNSVDKNMLFQILSKSESSFFSPNLHKFWVGPPHKGSSFFVHVSYNLKELQQYIIKTKLHLNFSLICTWKQYFSPQGLINLWFLFGINLKARPYFFMFTKFND